MFHPRSFIKKNGGLAMTQLKTSIKDITKTIIDPVCGMNVPFGKIDLLDTIEGLLPSIWYNSLDQ